MNDIVQGLARLAPSMDNDPSEEEANDIKTKARGFRVNYY